MHKFSKKNLYANGDRKKVHPYRGPKHFRRCCIKCSGLGGVVARICLTLLCGIEEDHGVRYFKVKVGTLDFPRVKQRGVTLTICPSEVILWIHAKDE